MCVFFDGSYKTILIINPHIKYHQLLRLVSQLEMIRARLKAHDNALTFLYTNFYFFIVMQALLTFITISLGLYLSKAGWDNVHKNFLTSFFIISGLLVFSRIVPDSMKFKQNIKFIKI